MVDGAAVGCGPGCCSGCMVVVAVSGDRVGRCRECATHQGGKCWWCGEEWFQARGERVKGWMDMVMVVRCSQAAGLGE